MEKLIHIISQKRELLARETFSRRPQDDIEDMDDQMKNRFIRHLISEVHELQLDVKARELVLEDFMSEKDKMADDMALLKQQVSELHEIVSGVRKELQKEQSKRKRAEANSRKWKEQLKFANKNRYGDKRQTTGKGKEHGHEEEADRNNEKDHFDGTEGTISTRSVGGEVAQEPAQSSGRKERDSSNRPQTYNTMGTKEPPVQHPSDDSKVPGRIIGRKFVKVFSFKTCLVEEQFEMVQFAEPGKTPKWGYFPTEGHPKVVTKLKGTKATPEFMQALAYEVYVKNVTFGLLHQWIQDMGMEVSKNTLRNWLKKGKKYLDKLVLVLKNLALEKDSIVHCDETWCKVRKYDHYKKCYIWVLVNKAEKIVIFFYEDGSRGRDVLTHFLGDAELKSIMTDGYNAYVFIGDELKTKTLKDTSHQICMSHIRAKFAKAAEQGGDKRALVFSDDLDYFFRKEREYDKIGLTPKRRFEERQSLETLEVLIRLRTNLDIELAKDEDERSPYLTEALNYLKKFWNGAFAFLNDGKFPIDNNVAERSIRKLTTQRNSSIHFGSDEGAEMAATYHSIISTVKLHGMSSWDFLGKFFKMIFNGCRDFLSMTPANIDMAFAKC